MRVPVVVEVLVNDLAVLSEDAVRVCVSAVVVDGVEDIVGDFVGASFERAGGRCGIGAAACQATDGRVDDTADVLPEGRDDRVQVDRVQDVVNHQH